MKYRYIGDVIRIEDYPYYDEEILSIDKLNKYMNYYLNNLKTLYNNGVRIEFIDSRNIKTNYNYESVFSKDDFDKWIYKLEAVNFGKELESNGIYWIASVQINEQNEFSVLEGGHRLHALQSINSDKKLLCIVEDKKTRIEDVILDKPIELYSLMLDKTAYRWLSGDLHLSSLTKIESNIYKVGTNNLYYLYHIMYFFGAFLGRLIYRYRDIIKPSPIINDEEEFYKFVNS